MDEDSRSSGIRPARDHGDIISDNAMKHSNLHS
jgi:hypothetical protein